MTRHFLDMTATESVRAAQAANHIRPEPAEGDTPPDRLGPREADFIAARDSFYMATVSQSGWPYVQHRGGPAGFLRVLDEATLGFADFRGNRQYISLGNVAATDRVALFLMDYPNRTRLKILAHIEPRDLAADPDLAARLVVALYRALPERAFLLRIEAFDWNCPQHITPRFTAAEIELATAPLRARLAELERENAALRAAAGESFA